MQKRSVYYRVLKNQKDISEEEAQRIKEALSYKLQDEKRTR